MKKQTMTIVCIGLLGLSAALLSSCAGTKKQEDTVRINISSEPDSLDPWSSAAADTRAVFRNVFDGLLLFASDGSQIPGIAESHEISADGLTYTFHLAKNVQFHNGDKLTSADAVYTYTKLAGLDGSKPVMSKYTCIESVSAPDDYTFCVKLKARNAQFLQLAEAAIMPRGYTGQAEHPVGAGPFKFVEYVPGQKIVLERFDDYYLAARKAKIKRAEVYIMTNAVSVVSALRSGELDIAYFINGNDAQTLKDDYTVLSSPQNMVQLFGLNNAVKPLDDIRVRRAINYAVDKQDIINGVWNGYATELYSNFSPVLGAFYNDSLSGRYSRDPAKARELLAEAGYPDGFTLTITVPANYEPHVNAAQILVSQLSEIGISAKIQSVEWAAWLSDVYKNANYESTVIAFDGKTEPHDILGRYVSSYDKNFIKYKNDRYDSLISRAAKETDPAARAELYRQCQELLTDDAASVYICDPNMIIAMRKDLKGYTFYPFSYIDFSTLTY